MEFERNLISPVPVEVKIKYLRLAVASKSSPGKPRLIQFYPSGKHHCSCPGWEWFRLQGKHDSKCRHFKLTTIPTVFTDPLGQLQHGLEVLKNKSRKMYVSWGFVSCQFPENKGTVHCTNCMMYPRYCNIHPTYTGSRGTSKPLVWKIQTALNNGRRKEALRMYKTLVKVAAALRGGRT